MRSERYSDGRKSGLNKHMIIVSPSHGTRRITVRSCGAGCPLLLTVHVPEAKFTSDAEHWIQHVSRSACDLFCIEPSGILIDVR
jgi:hypothetical protein